MPRERGTRRARDTDGIVLMYIKKKNYSVHVIRIETKD